MESQTAQQLTNDIQTESSESVNNSQVSVAIASDASNATDGLSEDNSLDLEGSIETKNDAPALPNTKKLKDCWIDEDGNRKCN
ncbi:hypothetical protein [Dendronalium sp. ChiSLP03b]|uniref:hypothetical protein n=1 Tax=Dendronalium sp. ChiSLP03b TaxID=3075381 RepID=UPI002AD56AE7|nr:hypothetical protein [Dendronalium sp. ChiSLP03b]MDZ8207375.1 hypothetical protein [Dendronalium sp. ChiSLP03b]